MVKPLTVTKDISIVSRWHLYVVLVLMVSISAFQAEGAGSSPVCHSNASVKVVVTCAGYDRQI